MSWSERWSALNAKFLNTTDDRARDLPLPARIRAEASAGLTDGAVWAALSPARRGEVS